MDDPVLDLAESIAARKNTPPLTRDLIRRFGGRGFIFNVRMWEAAVRDGPACRYVPADDYYRIRFETLAVTGVATRGGDVPLDMRFSALTLPVLRQAARDLGAAKLRDKNTGTTVLAAFMGAEAWLAERYSLDAFFLFRPEPWSHQELEELWHECTHEARDELARRPLL